MTGFRAIQSYPVRPQCYGQRTGSFQEIEANSSRSYSFGDDSYAPNFSRPARAGMIP